MSPGGEPVRCTPFAGPVAVRRRGKGRYGRYAALALKECQGAPVGGATERGSAVNQEAHGPGGHARKAAAALETTVDALMDGVCADLKRLAAIPSIAFPGFSPEPVLQARDLLVALLRDAGVADIGELNLPGTAPVITAGIPPPTPDAPTVLLYGHYDVQPPGDERHWTSPPFEPTDFEGGIRARGIADDKANLMVHIGTLRAYGGRPPVGINIIFEGQEEYGSAFDDYPPTDPDLFACDAMVIADTGNIRPGTPTLTTALRGAAEVLVEVRTLPAAVHSGQYGGPAPDALLVLLKALGTSTTSMAMWPSRACAASRGPAPA